MSILIDTNILFRRAQPVSPQHQVTLDCLTELVRAKVVMFLVPQVIYEFWSAATRPTNVNGLGMEDAMVQQSVDSLLKDFVLLKDERGIFGYWHSLVHAHLVRGKVTHDARLVAAMQRHGLTNLLTFNVGDFNRYAATINVFSPEDVQAGRLPR